MYLHCVSNGNFVCWSVCMVSKMCRHGQIGTNGLFHRIVLTVRLGIVVLMVWGCIVHSHHGNVLGNRATPWLINPQIWTANTISVSRFFTVTRGCFSASISWKVYSFGLRHHGDVPPRSHAVSLWQPMTSQFGSMLSVQAKQGASLRTCSIVGDCFLMEKTMRSVIDVWIVTPP